MCKETVRAYKLRFPNFRRRLGHFDRPRLVLFGNAWTKFLPRGDKLRLVGGNYRMLIPFPVTR